MELEISVEDLLNKRKIESDRIEFKAGWNTGDIYHSVCAFANDYNNDGGGYIAVGVEEKNGVAVRPVKGIPEFMLEEDKNVIENVIDITEKRIRECIPNYSKKKAARALEIVKMISDNPKVSIDEMRIELDVTDRTIARYISELKKHKIIARIGPDNGGSWKILL